MQFLSVPASEAERARAALIAHDALETRVTIVREDKCVLFPLRRELTEVPSLSFLAHFPVVERSHETRQAPQDLKSALADALTEQERELLHRSYDIVGSIAIVDIPSDLVDKEDAIADAILRSHRSVTTVLKKVGIHGGEFRTQEYTCIAGIDTRETLVVESGCSMLIDVEQVYFSVRLSTERLRIASLITPDEKVLVLFSGAAPYVVVFAKHSVAGRIVGVEKNPIGHSYALENLKRNKIPASRAAVYCGDAADLAFLTPTLAPLSDEALRSPHAAEGPFDRIVMMLPSGAKDFLESAVSVAVPHRCVLHVYAFGQESEVATLEQEIIGKLNALGWHAHVDRAVKAGHHKPFSYRYCFDVSIKKK